MEGAGPAFCTSCATRYGSADGIWECAPAFEPAAFPAARRDHLAAIEEQNFWFPARLRLIERILVRARPPAWRAALDLGCGTGAFLAVLARHFESVGGVDGHRASLVAARGRTGDAELFHADVAAVPLADRQFDLVSALDVLEHMDPERFLTEAARLLRPGGLLLLSVPACPALWSALDEAAGHRRRYTRAVLRAELAAFPGRLQGSTNYQMLLLPLALLGRRAIGGRAQALERRPPAWLNRLLGALNAFEVALLGGFSLPAGSSLVAWARKEVAT